MEKISLIYKFAVENYYDTVRKNKGLLTSEGIDVDGVNISLYNFMYSYTIKHASFIYSIQCTLHITPIRAK